MLMLRVAQAARGFARAARTMATSAMTSLLLLAVSTPTRAAVADKAVTTKTFDSLYNAVKEYVNLFLGFVGVIAVAAMMYGGFVMMTSGTNERKYEMGKQVLIKAGIGAVIAWASYYFAGLLKGFADKL